MKTVILSAIPILIIQIFIYSSSAKYLRRKIKCNRKNVVVVTLKFSTNPVEDNVSTSHGKSVFNATVCRTSINNKYCTLKSTIWNIPRCLYQHSNNRFQVKCYMYKKFLKTFGKVHSYSTFGLKVSIFQESRKRDKSIVRSVKMIPFTPAMICCHWMIDERKHDGFNDN